MALSLLLPLQNHSPSPPTSFLRWEPGPEHFVRKLLQPHPTQFSQTTSQPPIETSDVGASAVKRDRRPLTAAFKYP
jgi:hypothetical protein